MKKVWLAVAVLWACAAVAQQLPANTQPTISGMVKAGNAPLPGVSVVIGDATGRKVVTSTDADGGFSAVVPGEGHWVVRAELAAFSSATIEVVIDAAHPSAKVEMQLTLASRVPTPQQQMRQTIAARAGAQPGFQRLPVTEEAGVMENGMTNGADEPLPGMPSLGANGDMATESVAVNGSMGSTQDFARNFDELRDRIQEMRDRGELPAGTGPQIIDRSAMGGLGGMGGPMIYGGGPGGGPGGGGRGGPGRMIRGFNVNKPHGSLFYSIGDSALDAAPYSLNGVGDGKPSYQSNRFGGVIGGPLKIPKLFDDGNKTFFFLNFTGTRATTPYDVFSTVPTDAERAGDFSAFLPQQSGSITACNQTLSPADLQAGRFILCNRATGLPYANNRVPVSDSAKALLNYIPSANLLGALTQNYRDSTSQDTNGTNINLRLIHNFGATQMGRRGGGGGRGGRGGRARNNININFNYSSNNSDLLRPFATLGGTAKTQGMSLGGGHTLAHGRWTNQLRFNFNQNTVQNLNQFAGVTDVAAQALIAGASQNPADWGVPGLSFTNFQSLNDISPLARRDRVFQVSDTLIWTHGKHSLRIGGDFRRMLTRLDNNTNPRGTFTFTGFATAAIGADGKPVPGTGFDFADFLLGLPQQTTIQYSPNTYHFAANGYDLFVQDGWRVRSNLTLELGLRYEYVSPYTEADNRIVNLDVTPGFTAAQAVQPNAVGPFTGAFPASLVNPDRNNWAPRVGIAWKPWAKTVVRTGYGINYNLGQYKSIVQQLAFQPPFSFTQTNSSPLLVPSLTLQNGFPAPNPQVLTNNYGVDKNYRLGYVQMWNLDVQHELSKTLMLNVTYTGSKGTALDIVRAPNRALTGVLIANTQPFLWESSLGDSILHSGSVRLRKRMSHGMSIGGTYTYSKSIDNASSIGGSSVVVAQNDLDLAAERGLSSFDMRHRFTGDYMYELPFGTGKKWLDKGGPIAKVFGDWTWSGTFSIQSGNPWTARVIGNFADVARGSNGSLRADYNGLPIQLSGPSVSEWFNTAAFTAPPAGQLGTAGRNTIIGPGMVDFDMSLSKNFPIREMMGFEVRIAASNVFNTPHFTAIDTVVSSPTFGQVLNVGNMRRLQIVTRFRF